MLGDSTLEVLPLSAIGTCSKTIAAVIVPGPRRSASAMAIPVTIIGVLVLSLVTNGALLARKPSLETAAAPPQSQRHDVLIPSRASCPTSLR
jgi:hypothetical protein